MTNTKAGIVIEINEKISVSNSEHRFEAYCSECKRMTEMATSKTASVITNFSEREIFRMVEARSIHFVETGRVLICLESIMNLMRNSNITAGTK